MGKQSEPMRMLRERTQRSHVWSPTPSKTKPCQFSSVTSTCTHLNGLV